MRRYEIGWEIDLLVIVNFSYRVDQSSPPQGISPPYASHLLGKYEDFPLRKTGTSFICDLVFVSCASCNVTQTVKLPRKRITFWTQPHFRVEYLGRNIVQMKIYACWYFRRNGLKKHIFTSLFASVFPSEICWHYNKIQAGRANLKSDTMKSFLLTFYCWSGSENRLLDSLREKRGSMQFEWLVRVAVLVSVSIYRLRIFCDVAACFKQYKCLTNSKSSLWSDAFQHLKDREEVCRGKKTSLRFKKKINTEIYNQKKKDEIIL